MPKLETGMNAQAIIDEVNSAIGAHGMWKMRLRTAIMSGQCEITAAHACRDDKCAFGTWIYGPSLDAQVRAGVPYQVIKRLHAEFHQTAGGVLAQVERGNMADAKATMDGEFADRSEKLVRALTKWKGELVRLR
ncbi:CZB domain-containing protein [Novosphingobium acidiphilum]|uniref:CZB domain-containing protein n=1 Tax=Novosphingobium acidiphilum TaxID=505248 RepID=UPI00041B85A9|nr:CZB domain-containing protein [Novosphingobium acidiphilum]